MKLFACNYGMACACQEPPAPQTYDQRREEIARRRNPVVSGRGYVQWMWFDEVDGTPETSGIARAVARINAPYEPRCGCARWGA